MKPPPPPLSMDELVTVQEALESARVALDNVNRSAGMSTDGFMAMRRMVFAAEDKCCAALALFREDK